MQPQGKPRPRGVRVWPREEAVEYPPGDILKKWDLTPRREVAQTLQLLASVLTYLGKLQSVMGCIHVEPDPNLRNKEVLCEEMMHILKSE